MPAGCDAVMSGARTVVLVEGLSDHRAVTALAARWGRDLTAEGVAVLPMHGATNISHFLRRYGPVGLDLELAGLCDAAEMRFFQRGFEQAGLGVVPSRGQLEDRGFFVCDADLEDELIRALGTDAVEQVLAEQGDLTSFRILQRQPAQRGRSDHARLRRFMGTRGGRKIQYAPLLVAALDLADVPAPLARLMAAI
jgi:hypothetical protein